MSNDDISGDICMHFLVPVKNNRFLFFLIVFFPWLISGPGIANEGKQPSIGSGAKVISGSDVSDDSDQILIGSASIAGGLLRNIVEGEKSILFFILLC